MKIDYRRYKHPGVVFSLLAAHDAAADFGLLSRPRPQHPSLDPLGRILLPAVGAGQARAHLVSGVLSGNAAPNPWMTGGIRCCPLLFRLLVFLGLIVSQPDLGTAIACAAITACILFVAGMHLRYFGYAFAGSLLPLYFLIFHVASAGTAFWPFSIPYSDPQGSGFHIIQSLIAVSTGGMTGVGLMEGKQKLFYLPEPHTDFIFAVTAEELGLVGA